MHEKAREKAKATQLPAAPGAFLLLVVLSVLLGSCAPQEAPAPVRVGSKDFTEQLLIAEMYSALLEAGGITVERHLNVGGTQETHDALASGRIDLYPEYTGTGYLVILARRDNEKDPAKVYQTVAEEYRWRWQLIWLDPAPMNDTNAIACTREIARNRGLKTLSDLAVHAPSVRMAAIPDFPPRPDGLKGLQELYGGFQFRELPIYPPGQQYKAITDGKADCVIAFSTDGQVTAFHLVLLEDDKGLWPPYHPAPVIRSQVLEKHPEIRDILEKLSPYLTSETMSGLNWRVDGDRQEVSVVARQFLQSKGLVR